MRCLDYGATRGPLAADHVILNDGQVTWATTELAPPLLTTTPHQREDVSALDRFNVHSCRTRQVFSGTGLELVTRQATIRYLYHSETVARGVVQQEIIDTRAKQSALKEFHEKEERVLCGPSIAD
ncbi:uncharacterized protein TNCV_1907161 [Trichonephila clavipes]|nr:uncharacterized protein TNCV_1907161 [Trichonephila clavipes]